MVTAALLAACGCTTLPPSEREALVQATNMYTRGDTAAASTRLDRMIRDYGSAKEIAEAYYVRGLCRVKEGQVQPAVSDFEQAIQKSHREELTARCKASMAAVFYKQGNWSRAAELYQAAVPALPDQPPTDQILYFTGVALQRAGKWKDAAFPLARILRQFRDRPIASSARQLATWPHDYFSIQLAAYTNAEAAEQSARAYKAKGLDAFHENIARGGQALWVVMVGRYQNYADAAASLANMRKHEPGAFIIPQG